MEICSPSFSCPTLLFDAFTHTASAPTFRSPATHNSQGGRVCGGFDVLRMLHLLLRLHGRLVRRSGFVCELRACLFQESSGRSRNADHLPALASLPDEKSERAAGARLVVCVRAGKRRRGCAERASWYGVVNCLWCMELIKPQLFLARSFGARSLVRRAGSTQYRSSWLA